MNETTNELINLFESKLSALREYNERVTKKYDDLATQYSELSENYKKLEREYQTLQNDYDELIKKLEARTSETQSLQIYIEKQKQVLQTMFQTEYENLEQKSKIFESRASEILSAASN